MRNNHVTHRATTAEAPAQLIEKLRGIGGQHSDALVQRAARVVLGPSVLRVFRPGTSVPLRKALGRIDVAQLAGVRSANAFRLWYEAELDRIGRVIKNTNASNPRIQPGYKWGHAAKVLSLFVRELVLSSRRFPDAVAQRLERWLYVPIDRIALRHLKRAGLTHLGIAIKDIDSARKFHAIQDALAGAAKRANVPRIWFDDLWLERR